MWPQPSTKRTGFALRLEQGQGRLVLADRAVGEHVVVEQLQVALRHVPARLDLSQGVDRFRHQFGALEHFAFSVDELTLGQLLRLPAVTAGLGELEVRVVDGDILVAGELHEGVPFVARARVEPASLAGERAVLVSVYDARVYGPSRLAAPEVATALLMAAGLGERLAGPTCALFDPIDLGLVEVCAALGWKLPDRKELRLVEARAEAGRVRVVAARTEPARPALRPVADPTRAPEVALRYRRFLADYEAKSLYAPIEAEIAAGRLDRAAAAYERQLELHPDNPFLVARLLHLWTVRAETRSDALALARGYLERWPDDLDALSALGLVQLLQGAVSSAAETWRRVARIAESHGDVVEAAQALCGVARALTPREPAAAVEALEQALTLRRRLPGALRALAGLHERAGNMLGAIQARERLLAAEEDPARRAALCFELGALSLKTRRDPEGAVGWFERTLELTPEDVDAWLGLADAQAEAGRALNALRSLDRAAQLLQARGDQSRAAEVFVRLGDLWRRLPEGGAATASLRYRQALLLRPGLKGALLGLAEIAISEGDARRARGHLEELLRAPDSEGLDRAELHLSLGRLFAGPLEEPAHAALQFQRALEGSPAQADEALEALEHLFRGLRRWDDLARTLELAARRAESPVAQAGLWARLAVVVGDEFGDSSRALQLQRRAVELAPRNTSLLDGLLVRLRAAKDAAALAAALEARAQLPGEPGEVARWHAERGALLRERLNDADAAAMAFGLALGCDPNDLTALEGLADIERERERFAELAHWLGRRALLEAEARVSVPLWLELARLQLGPLARAEAARESLERALSLSPDETEALRALASLHAAAGRYPAAERHMRRLIEVYEQEGFDEPAGAVYAAFAEILAAQHRDTEALEVAGKARDADPNRIPTYETAQDMLLKRGDVEGIVAFMVAGLERARKADTIVFLARRAGRLLWRELRRPAEAAPLIDRVLSERPDDGDAWRLRVEVATALADWPMVASGLRAQLDRAPAAERPDILVRLGALTLESLQRVDEGVALLRAALQAKPGHRPAEERLFAHGVDAGDAALVLEFGERWLDAGTLDAALASKMVDAVVLHASLAPEVAVGLLTRLEAIVPEADRGRVAATRDELEALWAAEDSVSAPPEGTPATEGPAATETLAIDEAELRRILDADEDPLETAERALRATADAAQGTERLSAALLTLGEFLRDERQALEAALETFESALRHAEPGSEVWTAAEEALEEVHGARGDWSALLALYDLRLAHGAGDATELNIMRAAVLRRLDRLKDAIAAAEAGLPDERARDLLVSLLEQARRPIDAARRLTEDLAGLRPDDAAHRHWRAAGLLTVTAPAQALVHFQSAAAALADPALADEWLAHAREVGDARALVAALVYRAECFGTTGGDAVRRSRMLFEAGGVLLETVDDVRGARRLLERALEAWPDNVDALERLGLALEALGDYDALAVTLERQVAAAVPGPWRGRLAARLAEVHGRRRGDRVAAEAAAQQAAADLDGTPDVDALALWLAPAGALPVELEPQSTSSEGALPLELTPALQPVPTAGDAATHHEQALLSATATTAERVNTWRALLEMRSRVPDLQRLLGLLETRLAAAPDSMERATLRALGAELWRARLGNVERARQGFEAALLEDEASPRAHLGLGQLALDRGDLTAAVEHLQRALENRAPRGAGLQAEEELAAFHRLRRALNTTERSGELIERALRMLEANPGCRPALDAVDQALAETEALPQVIRAYEQALAIDDARRNARLWRRLSELHARAAQPEAARVALDEALRLNPDDLAARVTALRWANQAGAWRAFRQHGAALRLQPPERWVQSAADAPTYLRSLAALDAALDAAPEDDSSTR